MTDPLDPDPLDTIQKCIIRERAKVLLSYLGYVSECSLSEKVKGVSGV